VFSNSNTFKDESISSLQQWELAGQGFLFEVWGGLGFLVNGDFFNFNVSEIGGNEGEVSEDVSWVVNVEFL